METLYALSHIGYTIPPQADAARRTFYTDGARPGGTPLPVRNAPATPCSGLRDGRTTGVAVPVGARFTEWPTSVRDEKRA